MSPLESTDRISCAPFIKEIGRGKEGARGLSRQAAAQLYGAILNGQVDDLELGAVLIALRVKGESTDELLGFLDSIASHWPAAPAHLQVPLAQLKQQTVQAGKPLVVIPSYNGARRKPNYTPLLAGLLALEGYPVLVHGLDEDPTGRVTSAQVFKHIDWPTQLAHNRPQFMALPTLYPALGRLLGVRKRLGVRNCTHTLVKLLVPAGFGNTLLVTSYTHPEFWHLQREVLAAVGQTALVLRAHEGEPVAAPHRTPRMDAVKNGGSWCVGEGGQALNGTPDPKPDTDAQQTAAQITAWLHQPASIPQAFLDQLAAIAAIAHA